MLDRIFKISLTTPSLLILSPLCRFIGVSTGFDGVDQVCGFVNLVEINFKKKGGDAHPGKT